MPCVASFRKPYRWNTTTADPRERPVEKKDESVTKSTRINTRGRLKTETKGHNNVMLLIYERPMIRTYDKMSVCLKRFIF